jgi:hypothetical protein
MKRLARFVASLFLAAPLAALPQFDDGYAPPRLGIAFFPADIAEAGGIRLVEVVPGFPAAAAGLRAGDVIIAFDGVPPPADGDLLRALAGHAPSARITVEFLREGTPQKAEVALTPPKPEAVDRVRETAWRLRVGRSESRADHAEAASSRATHSGSRPASRAISAPPAAERGPERLLAEAQRLIAKEPPTKADLAEARRLIAEAETLMDRARRPAPDLRPKSVIARAQELFAAGRSPEEIERLLTEEFGMAVVIAGESRPAESRPTSRPSTRSAVGPR